MSDQTNQPEQTTEELRQSLLSQIDESKKIIGELNEEELEAVSGGFSLSIFGKGARAIVNGVKGMHPGAMINSAMISTSLMPSSPTTPTPPPTPAP